MAIFICPACDKQSDIKENGNEPTVPFVCPHCGEEFQIDREANLIMEE